GLIELARELLDPLTHDLASFEFHSRPGWNHEAAAGLIRVSPDARFCQPGLENTEVAQFNRNVVCQTVRDFIECALDHVEDFMLNHAGLIADGDNDVAFG